MSSSQSVQRPHPQDLADETIATVRRWLTEAADPENGTGKRDVPAERLAGLLKDPHGLTFAIGFVDRVVRPSDLRVAGRNLEQVSRRVPRFLPWYLRIAIQLAGGFAPLLPWPIVPIARWVFRGMVSHLVLDATPKQLDKHLARLRDDGARLNLNLLGEAVLGLEEADRRLANTRELLAREDVQYVSIKVSAVSGKLGLWAYDETVDRVVARLTPLYEQAAASASPKFINLDMEEFHDLDLTIAVFKRLLDQPKLTGLEAGIVLQAYLPDALRALQDLTEWATRRRADGGATIKVRVVKGANLAMERVDAIKHGWPLATFSSKQETDTNYKRVLSWAMTPERTDSVRLGVAGHNLFDIAFAWLLAKERKVAGRVEFEMLLGMATAQADAVKKDVGQILLYTPVVPASEFNAAIAYLIRRLEENASPENFMSAVFELADNERMFEREKNRFVASLAELDDVVPTTNRLQNRLNPSLPDLVDGREGAQFANTPNTDPSIAANRVWGRQLLERARHSNLGAATVEASVITRAERVQELITTTVQAGEAWGTQGANARAAVLHEVGDVLSAYRGRLIEVLVSEYGMIISEADAEASSAIDFAHYYAEQARELESVENALFVPSRLTVVIPDAPCGLSWLAGSVLGALAAGSGVILKPSRLTSRSAAVVLEALWEAGVPRPLITLVSTDEPELHEKMVTHPNVDRVLLCGSGETVQSLRTARPDLPLHADLGARNTMIVTPSADIDLAVADIVTSALAHAGQAALSSSLVILVGSAAKSEQFRRQLTDAITSLKPGPSQEPATSVGPLLQPPAGSTLHALTALDEGESWLVQPQPLAGRDGVLWSPGVKDGVVPGSQSHLSPPAAPAIGIMSADTLDDAIQLHNATSFGLAAGIHSLDPAEIATWIDSVEAGNLFVNRPTTGALVQRQPVGGWKGSHLGSGAKAGGPNYLLTLGDWEPIFADPRSSVRISGVGDAVVPVIEAAQPSLEFLEFDRVRAGAVSDQRAWENIYGLSIDTADLGVERNVLRYLPAPATIRLAEGQPLAQLIRVIVAATRAGAPIAVSSAVPLPAGLIAMFGRDFSPTTVESVVVESDVRWNARARGGELSTPRIRLIGSAETRHSLSSALERHDVAVYAGPVTTSGRLELLPFLREQVISMTAHRYGNPDPQIASIEF
jgi:RHH-type proline utilization regulon transcriptional repressor/proline dehydrogenase/delta 1-pyrroline-5-carboxylate dehydrogenase